jgi:hypothetical protein
VGGRELALLRPLRTQALMAWRRVNQSDAPVKW